MAIEERPTKQQAANLGAPRLTTLHAIGQSLAIGPIFSAGILLTLVAVAAGDSVPAAVLLGTVGVLALAYVLSLYARRFAGAGAVYEYLAKGGSPALGTFSAGIYFTGSLIVVVSMPIIIGVYANSFWTTHISPSGAPPWWLFDLIAISVMALLNYFGVRLAVAGVLTLAALSAVPLITLAFVILAKGGHSGQAFATLNPAHGSSQHLFSGLLFAVTLFIGFECAGSIAEETKNPRRSIPIALVGSVALAGVFYILIAYTTTIGFGAGHIADWVSNPDPLGTLADTYVGSWLGTIIDLVIIVDMLSVAIAVMVTCSRGLYVLSRERFLPKAIARTSRYKSPAGGIVVCVIAALLALLWASVSHYGAAFGTSNPFGAWLILVGAGTLLIVLVYAFLALLGFKLVKELRRGAGGIWRYVVVLIALAVPVLAYKGSADPWPKYPASIEVYFSIAVIAASAAWVAALRWRRPEALRNAASYAVQENTDEAAAQ